MRYIEPLSSIVLAVGAAQASAQAPAAASQGCQKVSADAEFEFRVARKTARGFPTNQGIVPAGFVTLAGMPSVDGIDVSKYQADADFRRVRDCGGRFAYVRMSYGTFGDNELEYRVHWANSRAVGLMTGGYHFLKVPALSLTPDALRRSDFEKLMNEAADSAHAQAQLFLARLDEVLALDEQSKSRPRQLGQPVLPLALSAGSVASTPGLGAADLVPYAKLYRAEICEWVRTVRESPAYATHPIILFTYPHIYLDYGFDAADCGVSSMTLWIGYLGLQGRQSPPEDDDQSQAWKDVCLRASKDRCRFQLYTSYGSFLDFKGEPAVDLDRFIGTEAEMAQLLTPVPKH